MIERFESLETPRPTLRTRPSVIASRGPRSSWGTWIVLGVVAVGIGVSVRESAAQAGAGKTTFDGVYTEAQSARGEKTSAMSCSVCHGDKLAGTDMGPGVQGAAFRETWSGRSLGELFDKIKTTMPANEPGTLSAAATADVLAYVLKVNDYPAGAAELPSEMAALSEIKLRHQK